MYAAINTRAFLSCRPLILSFNSIDPAIANRFWLNYTSMLSFGRGSRSSRRVFNFFQIRLPISSLRWSRLYLCIIMVSINQFLGYKWFHPIATQAQKILLLNTIWKAFWHIFFTKFHYSRSESTFSLELLASSGIKAANLICCMPSSLQYSSWPWRVTCSTSITSLDWPVSHYLDSALVKSGLRLFH